jgi:ABC-type transport system involved in multi-copper enzyme maturation permease subunit
MRRDELVAAAWLDVGEVLRSRWLVLCLGVYALLGAVFVLVGMRESSVYGFTGTGRVLFSLCHALVILLPLLALLATGQVVNRARDDGTLELLLSHPIGRTAYLAGVTLIRGFALAAPLVLVLGALTTLSAIVFDQAIPFAFLIRSIAIAVTELVAFVGLGIATSVMVRHPARAITVIFVIWAASVALLDFAGIGLMLRWRVPAQAVFALAVLNPVQAARMALLSTAEPSLATLGPVGFYLANRVGSAALFAIGLVWPALVGVGAWLLAWRAFRRGDLV